MSRGKRWFYLIKQSQIIWLSSLEVLGPASWQKIYRAYPSLTAFLADNTTAWQKLGLSQNQIKALQTKPNTILEEKLLVYHNIELITIDDPNYPTLLREINDPPLWLFVRGNKSAWEGKCLTVVGSRAPSSYGRMALEKILPSEIIGQLVICSGLAYGIDSLAHRQSLEANGRTVAVLAGGLDKIYPSSHTKLAEQIISKGGALLSEYPPGSAPRPYRFPIRNRILAGLSPATVVVEAKIRSGSLTTARSAIDYNRDLFALPGDITRPTAEGPNFLLSKGAIVLYSSAVLADYYNLTYDVKERRIDSTGEKILHLLDEEAKSLDNLVEEMEIPIQEVLGLLTELELAGLVYQTEINYYARKG